MYHINTHKIFHTSKNEIAYIILQLIFFNAVNVSTTKCKMQFFQQIFGDLKILGST